MNLCVKETKKHLDLDVKNKPTISPQSSIQNPSLFWNSLLHDLHPQSQNTIDATDKKESKHSIRSLLNFTADDHENKTLPQKSIPSEAQHQKKLSEKVDVQRTLTMVKDIIDQVLDTVFTTTRKVDPILSHSVPIQTTTLRQSPPHHMAGRAQSNGESAAQSKSDIKHEKMRDVSTVFLKLRIREPLGYGGKRSSRGKKMTARNRVAHSESDNPGRIHKKRGPKSAARRGAPFVSNMKPSQDKLGKLTDCVVFPDSTHTLTLREYKKDALNFEMNIKRCLARDPSIDLDRMKSIAKASNYYQAGDDWLRNPDVMEELFWSAMQRGVEGRHVIAPYGVDVEVEGAFDSNGCAYAEWYGEGKKKPKSSKRRRSASVKVEEDLEESSKADVKSEIRPVRTKEEPVIRRPRSRAPFPVSHVGNINDKGILRHMPRMPGINHTMFYVGQMYSRFCWHVEDAFLNSVSYLHEGSAPKVWYAVPPSYAEQFEKYAAENIFSRRMQKEVGTAQHLLMNKTTTFNPRDIKRSGIDVYRVVHKPGSFVLTAPRAYHAGFNCGYNVAEAVNYANPAWFPVGRDAMNFMRSIVKPLCVPFEHLLFHEAKATRDAIVAEKTQNIPSRLHKAMVATLAEELRKVVNDGERRIREYALKTNCRVRPLADVQEVAKATVLGFEEGHGAVLVCDKCGHSAHFYGIICATCQNNVSSLCLMDGKDGKSVCGHSGHSTMVVRRHDPVLVADILTDLEEYAGIERTPKEISERYRGYIRPWETPVHPSGIMLKMNLKRAASKWMSDSTGGKMVQVEPVRKERRTKRARPPIALSDDSDSDYNEKATKRRKLSRGGRTASRKKRSKEVEEVTETKALGTSRRRGKPRPVSSRTKAASVIEHVPHISSDDGIFVSIPKKE